MLAIHIQVLSPWMLWHTQNRLFPNRFVYLIRCHIYRFPSTTTNSFGGGTDLYLLAGKYFSHSS